MEKYIAQLIEDLNRVADNPPPEPFIESPPHLVDYPHIAELALAPFQTIEELTGIKQEAFPDMTDLQGDQWKRVNEAIFMVFESLKIELIDAPPEMPPEILYEVLTTNWQAEVQYLPLSGMDLELCTGDSMTCPYGEYCHCGEDWEEEEMLPEKFGKVVPSIAQAIDAGQICFLNMDTLETEDIIPMLLENPAEFEAVTGEDPRKASLKHINWEEYMAFYPLESYESYQIMESFIDAVEDDLLQNKLAKAINQKRPFARFRAIIDNSEQRQRWFDFKQQEIEAHVRTLIIEEINKSVESDFEEINGIYNDDGTKVDMDSIPVPSLCVICKHHNSDDFEENILCLLNRSDQKDDDNFECGSYEKE